MNRRFFLVTTLGLALSGVALPALAQDRTEDVLRSLRDQGYDEIAVSRTWLGRTRITAAGHPGRREIVLNPNTGEILRDFWEAGSDTGGPVSDDQSGDDDSDDGDDDGSDDNGGDDGGSDDGGHGGSDGGSGGEGGDD